MKTIINFYITLAFAASLIPAVPLYAMSYNFNQNQHNPQNQENEEIKESAQEANQQPLSPEQQTHINGTLFNAAKNSDVEAARTALMARADVNTRGLWGITPLMMAVRKNSLFMVTLLLTHKANVHTYYPSFGTALFSSIGHGDSPEIVNLLLENNADINGRENGRGTERTPLICASQMNHIKTVKTLLCAGADTTLVELNDENPLYYNKTAFDYAQSDEMRATFAEVPRAKKEAREAVEALQELLMQQILENNCLPVTSVANIVLDYAVPYINAVEYYFLNKSIEQMWRDIKKTAQTSQSTPYSAAAAMPAPQPLLMTPLMDTEENEKEQASEQVISATNTVPTPSMPESFRASAYRNALQWQETRVAAENGLQAPPTPNENGFYDSDPE